MLYLFFFPNCETEKEKHNFYRNPKRMIKYMIRLITKRPKQVCILTVEMFILVFIWCFSGLSEAFCFQVLRKQMFFSGLVFSEEK